MSDLLVFDSGNGLTLSAAGAAEAATGTFKFKFLRIESTHGAAAKATIELDTEIGVPLHLLEVLPSGGYVFRAANKIAAAQGEWAASRERLRRQLAQPFDIVIDQTKSADLFGMRTIGGSAIAARLWLAPEIVDGPRAFTDNDVILRVAAKADLRLELRLTTAAAASIEGRWRIAVEIRKATLDRAIEALLALDVPALPALDLDWPRFALPNLRFDGCKFPLLGRLPSFFPAALPPFADRLTFAPATAADIELSIIEGDASIALTAPGGGSLKYDGAEICGVSGVTFACDQSGARLTAVLTPANLTLGPTAISVPTNGRPDLPFTLIGTATTVVAFGEIQIGGGPTVPKASLVHTITGLRISAADDPSLFITLDITFTTDVGADGGVSTKLSKLEIVAPYSLTLIANAIEASGELIRLIAAIPLPNANLPGFDSGKLKRLLGFIAGMLRATMTWLARRAEAASGVLAGAVEGAARALGQVLDAIAKVDATVFKLVLIEVRLDPKTYHVRQIVLTPANDVEIGGSLAMTALGFDVAIAAAMKPSLLIDVGPESWFGLVVEAAAESVATLGTDLWLDKETGPQQPLGTLDGQDGSSSRRGSRLIEMSAWPGNNHVGTAKRDIVLIALQRGRLRLLQTFDAVADRAAVVRVTCGGVLVSVQSRLQNAVLKDASIGSLETDDIIVSVNAGAIKGRILALLPKSDATGEGSFAKMLSQRIEIEAVALGVVEGKTFTLALTLTIHLGDRFIPKTTLNMVVNLRDLSMRLSGGDRISIMADKGKVEHYQPLGFDLEVRQKPETTLERPAAKVQAKLGEVSQNPETPPERYEQFYLDLSSGGEKLALSKDAVALLSYDRVASEGKGLQFELSGFAVGRSGIDLEARILPEPVVLGGIDMPFKFTSGQISISGSRFSGGSLIGSGQLPKTLIGEANATIALTLGKSPSSDDVVVEAATALIDKSGDPIRCHTTRFDITITELGLGFVREQSYHFYFLVTGSARFNPEGLDFASGLLKNFGAAEIRFDKAPLTRDPRVLMRSISFLVKLKPPKTINLFNIFNFELRSIAFYPAADKFDGDPAMGFGGQVKFLERGDSASVQINFHEMLIGPPKSGDFLPRIRFDGLSVVIALNGVRLGGTAITIDGDIPSLYRPKDFPKNLSAQGFLASGTIEVDGWAPMSATLGFLELTDKDNRAARPRHAFFLYGQLNKLSVPIDTPIGTIYLREYGFGFGYRYTLAGIAQAASAKTPQESIEIFDEVSKLGSLDRFEAWQATYDNADLTLALRGMLALSAAQRSSTEYNAEVEATLPNPLLFDIVAALRTDLTILINLRAWLSVNYHKWATDGADEAWKRQPVFRGYIYFSAPRREFLGRFLSAKDGFIGDQPPLPAQLKKGIESSDFAATLYIRPGLFHFELGWPYEIGFELGKPGDQFYLRLRGGMIYRVEDFAILQGIAFKAYGEVHLEGRIGSDSFGAAAIAHATFNLESRLLSYLSLRNFDDSMYYGYLRIDVLIDVNVEVWLSFKVFGHRIRLSAGFSMHLAVSLAIEGVISPSGLGGRAHAAVGIRAFGRTASVGIGFKFNDDLLERARARVAGFMTLGLTTAIPDKSQDGQRVELNPPPEPPRRESAAMADQTIDTDLGSAAAPQEADDVVIVGRDMTATNFWALLFPTTSPNADGRAWFVMQLVPRDHTPYDPRKESYESLAQSATFFASPKLNGKATASPWHTLLGTIASEGFFHLEAEKGVIPAAINVDYRTDANATIDADQKVKLVDALPALFLDPRDDAGNLTEPGARDIGAFQVELEPDPKASAATLARYGRSRIDLSAKRKREARVEEARSAILASVVDSAARLAAQTATTTVSPPRHAEIDARDFGLTFLVSRPALEAMFTGDLDGDTPDPLVGRFTVRKSDATEAGTVVLFNPPGRMFRAAQPRFAPKHVISDQGIMLDWDLEPAWGQSEGAYHDPEFHLRHYRVRRTVRGVEAGSYRAEFVVKAAAPIKLSEGSEASVGLSMLRPPFQFIDDLRQFSDGSRQAAFPEALRAVLLKSPHAKASLPGDNKTDFGLVDILYEIVPVDIAGTSDVGQPYVVSGFADKPRPASPRQATLQVKFTSLGTPGAAVLRALLTPKPPEPPQAKLPALHLRVLTETIEALGTYGVDAIDQSGRFDERSIERLRGADVVDYVVTPKLQAGTAKLEIVFQDDRDSKVKDLVCNGDAVKKNDGVKLVDSTVDDILKTLGVGDGDAQPGRSRRLFIRTLAAPAATSEDLMAADRHGEWRTMPVNIAIAPDVPDPRHPPFSAIVESFERPIDLAFKALCTTHDDASGENGRLHIAVPRFDGDLSDLTEHLDDQKRSILPTLRDPLRRTATKLTWRVNARSLRRTSDADKSSDADLYRWVGGYDIHVIDPDALAPSTQAPPSAEQLADAAQYVGRVGLVPPSFDGLEPSGFGDFGKLEAAYPSETLRLLNPPKKQAGGVRIAGWYSAAESTAIFPQPSIRRSLMPDPDEALIASLFARGKPDALRVSIPAWIEKGSDPLADWKIAVVSIGVPPSETTTSDPVDLETETKIARFQPQGGFAVADVRRLVQNLCLVPSRAKYGAACAQETQCLGARIASPKALAAVTIRIEALRKVAASAPEKWVVVATREHAVDLAPALHPILVDAMAFLPYAAQAATGDDGKVYRRYSIVPDPDPEVTAKTYADWLGEAPPERDRYGWRALRTFGLAQGFRLYDSERGDYVRGKSLLGLIKGAMTRALARYSDRIDGKDARFNGQPFVDVLTKPWGNAKLFWFDGGNEGLGVKERTSLINRDTLAVVQIALRPAPDALVGGLSTPPRRVRYFAIDVASDLEARPEWTLAPKPMASPDLSIKFDALALSGGIDAHPAIRLEKNTSFAFKVSPSLPRTDGKTPSLPGREGTTTIAVIRALCVQGDFPLLVNENQINTFLSARLNLKKAGEDYPFSSRALTDPAVLDAGYDGIPDPAFGRFEQLKPGDWADVLFRPQRVGGSEPYVLDRIPAFAQFAYYTARRFGFITLQQGLPVPDKDNPPDGLKEQESARAGRETIAADVIRVWSHFLDYCAPCAAAPETIFYSLGTVADPGIWRPAPDASGEVSIVIPDQERRGARRKFAIRPFGRYESWVKALRSADGTAVAPPDLHGAFDADAALQFVDVTLPRTEPLEKPVILSAVRRKPRDGDPNDLSRMEIVVAHNTDMVLAQANVRNDALLAPLGLAVGYLREFPYADWLHGLVASDTGYDALAEFGSSAPDPDFTFPSLDENQAKTRLRDIRTLVPDAWLGSTMVSAASLPYFFRTHVLVYASAGVVVSETTRSVFEQGIADLSHPSDMTRGYKSRTASARPTYAVLARNDAGQPVISFDLAIHRFIDCMREREAELWFGNNGEHWGGIKAVAHLPEPGISYQIGIEAVIGSRERPEIIARTVEFDLLPTIQPNTGRGLSGYIVQTTGQVLKDKDAEPSKAHIVTPPEAIADWRLPLRAEFVGREIGPISRNIKGGAEGLVVRRLNAIVDDPAYAGAPLPIDEIRNVTITYQELLSDAEWTLRLEATRAALKSAPEALAILEQWPAQPGLKSELTLPLSYAARVKAAALERLKVLCGAPPIEADEARLLFRIVPTDEELMPFVAVSDPPQPGEAELCDMIRDMAAEQLFGGGRRLVVAAMKGTIPPLYHPIRRAIIGERP